MKINSNLVIELAVIFMVFCVMFIAFSQIETVGEDIGTGDPAYTYLECFEDPDVNETNPDGKDVGGTTIYTYAETDWILANVTDLYGAPVSDQSYWVNDSDGDGCYSTFTFASKAYTSASFYFMMNDAYHKQTIVRLEAADGSDLMFPFLLCITVNYPNTRQHLHQLLLKHLLSHNFHKQLPQRSCHQFHHHQQLIVNQRYSLNIMKL